MADVERVVDKFIGELAVQLADRNVTIELSEAARHWLAQAGFDRVYGARPMARLIQQHVKEPLAEEVLFGKLQHGGRAVVTVRHEALVLEFFEPQSAGSDAIP